MNRLLHNFCDNLAGFAMSCLPPVLRRAAQGAMPQLDKPLSKSFVFKLAQSKEELEACFRLLYTEYVKAKLMKPDSSGMRIILHHALPTTSTLICKYRNHIIGTVSLIRENKFGFPMQKAFNLDEVLKKNGNVAEVLSLAIDSRFRSSKNKIMIPLLKFLYEYAEYRFDTRYLVIAVNPRHISFYEDVLCFRRLRNSKVNHYSLVNGAPAIGAYLDLEEAKETFFQKYAQLPLNQNLYHYFTAAPLPNGYFPHRRFHTTTDPVMTPELIDYFFNKKTKLFSKLNSHEIDLLHAIYNLPEYQHCLPPQAKGTPASEPEQTRIHRRFPVRCPARLRLGQPGVSDGIALTVYECSEKVFCAHAEYPLMVGLSGEADIDLGESEHCTLAVEIVRLSKHHNRAVMFHIRESVGTQNRLWLKFVRALSKAHIATDLEEATRFYDTLMVAENEAQDSA
ncbi:MAG: hypothetical protein LBG78_08790 [Azoarcus sp.]|jgi:hypothetical protein|nr:hypothetical protein [Azoarcus sp.]